MKKWELYRGVEDPISGTFNLAEEVTSRSDKVVFLSRFALYFVVFSLVLDLLLFIAMIFNGNLFMAMILFSLLITGGITFSLIRTTRDFLKHADFRYGAINAMREGPAVHNVPSGKTPTERFLRYLKKANPAFRRLLVKRPELLVKDVHLVGTKGRRYRFEAAVQLRPSILHRMLGKGSPGYNLLIREYRKVPTQNELERLHKDLTDIYHARKLRPNRVVMLFPGSGRYKGLPEDLYHSLVVDGLFLPGRMDLKLNVQAVGELPNGEYDFVPYIPELPRMLP